MASSNVVERCRLAVRSSSTQLEFSNVMDVDDEELTSNAADQTADEELGLLGTALRDTRRDEATHKGWFTSPRCWCVLLFLPLVWLLSCSEGWCPRVWRSVVGVSNPEHTAPTGRPYTQPSSSLRQITLPMDPAGGNEEYPCGSTRPRGGNIGRPFRCADALADVEKTALAKAPSRKPVNIAVMTIASGYGDAKTAIQRNRDEYVSIHGYKLVLIVSDGQGYMANVSDNLLKLSSDWDSRGFPWGKVKAIEILFDQMPDITHVFWLDADIVLTNLRVGLEWLALLDYSFVACGDENGINTGAFMMRNDAFSRNLLRRTYVLYPSFANHPWFEQGAMIGVVMSKLAATDSSDMSSVDEANLALQAFHAATKMADTPACIDRLNAELPTSSKEFVLLVPQCLFGRRADTWAKGSFAVHFAGLSREEKVRLFIEYETKVLRDNSLVNTVALPENHILNQP